MNFIFIAGHLGADPETRFTSEQRKVTSLRVATNLRKSGKEETLWWKVDIWGEQFDKMIAHLKKGAGVMIYGEMKLPEIYKAKDGSMQISLSMTAHSLHFPPFGNKEKNTPLSQAELKQPMAVPQEELKAHLSAILQSDS